MFREQYDDNFYQSGAYPLENTESLEKYLENVINESN